VSVLVLTGSARRGSYTRRLGEALAAALPGGELGPRLTVLPWFDQDLEAATPPEVEALRAQVRAAAA
jgi:NAD(P)H-dependent FMN reductase